MREIQMGVTAAIRRQMKLITGTDPLDIPGIEELPEPDPNDQDVVVIAMPVHLSSVRVSGSVIEQCSVCQCDVWIGPLSPKARRVCLNCVGGELSRLQTKKA